jgi:hypothetical protein
VSTTGQEYHLETALTEPEFRRGIKLMRDSQGITDQTWLAITLYLVAGLGFLAIWAVSSAHEWGFLVPGICLLVWTGYLWFRTRLRFIVWRLLRREGGHVLESAGSMIVTDEGFVFHGRSDWAGGSESHVPWSAVKRAVRDRDDSMLVVMFGPRDKKAIKALQIMVPRAITSQEADDAWPALVSDVEQHAEASGFELTTHLRNWNPWQ